MKVSSLTLFFQWHTPRNIKSQMGRTTAQFVGTGPRQISTWLICCVASAVATTHHECASISLTANATRDTRRQPALRPRVKRILAATSPKVGDRFL